MTKKTEYVYEQRFFNEGTYNASKLTERLNKAAVKVNSDFKMWYNKSVLNAYDNALETGMQHYWVDKVVKAYSDCLWCKVYNNKGKTKKADKAANLASEQFERNFK